MTTYDDGAARAPDERVPPDLEPVWDLTAAPPPPPGGWRQFRAYLDRRSTEVETPVEPARAPGPASQPRRSGWSRLLLQAAMVVIGLGLGLLWPYASALWTPAPVTVVTTPVRANTVVELPGDVVVRLNAVSTLSYTERGGRVETVELTGEGYFDVPHGRDEPFVVRTAAGVVRDLGTRFNVRARDGEVAVVVREGVVALEAEGQGVRVTAGHMSSAALNQAPTQPRAVNVDAALAWTEGRLVVRDRPLDQVVGDLQRRYGIVFAVAPELGSARLTANLGPETNARTAATAICATIGAKCERTRDGWRITSR